MTLQDWGAIGELVGGIAVIITLIYLAIQIRQNTSVVKTTNFLNLSKGLDDFTRMVAENEELNDLYLKGSEDFHSLSITDKSRFNMLLSVLIHPYQSMYQMKARGHIDEKLMLNSFDLLSALLNRPGVRQWWEENKFWWEAEFQAFMSGLSNTEH
jgi:hypothetical protein